MRLPFLFAGLLLIQGPAWAQVEDTFLSKLDVYYAYPQISVEDLTGSTDGTGYGARLWVGRSWPIVTVEYQRSQYDGVIGGQPVGDGEIRDMRAGLGIRMFETSSLSSWLRAEYVQYDMRDAGGVLVDDDGLGLHIGLRGGHYALSPYGEFGGIKTQDMDNRELRLGLVWEPANWGLLIEYKMSRLYFDDAPKYLQINDVHAGVRWNF